MAEWDELQGRKGEGVVETLQRGCGLNRKSQHGRWRRNEKGKRVPRDVFIDQEFYFTDTKNRGEKKIHKVRQVCVCVCVCVGDGGSKEIRPHVLFLCFLILESETKVIDADVISDTRWHSLRNSVFCCCSFVFPRSCSHTIRLVKRVSLCASAFIRFFQLT
jgi:hypothetical protein